MKVLLIGGYPKGHDRPFHPLTASGKRLRKMVEEIGLDVRYLDLWQTYEEEHEGAVINVHKIATIKHSLLTGVKCVALGKWVKKCLNKQGISIPYLPHPASRRLVDREKLKEGLIALNRG